MTANMHAKQPYRSPTKRRSLFSKGVHETELKALARQMVDAVSEDEKEHAARSSYKYLWKAVNSKEMTKELQEERD